MDKRQNGKQWNYTVKMAAKEEPLSAMENYRKASGGK